MTDIEHTTTEESKGLDITAAQVVAYALAAITAAVLGSFFGFSGSLIGAGLASVISTVGAALYERAMQRAHEKTKNAAKRALRNSSALRVDQVQQQQSANTRTGPQQPARQQPGQRQPGPQPSPRVGVGGSPERSTAARMHRPVDPSARIADLVTPPEQRFAEQATRRLPPLPQPTQQAQQAQPTRQQQVEQSQEHTAVAAPWWRRNLKLLIGMAAAVFVIGVAGVSGIELLSGGPLSGGSGGTSVGRVITGNTAGDQQDRPDQQAPSSHDGGTTQHQRDPGEAGTDSGESDDAPGDQQQDHEQPEQQPDQQRDDQQQPEQQPDQPQDDQQQPGNQQDGKQQPGDQQDGGDAPQPQGRDAAPVPGSGK